MYERKYISLCLTQKRMCETVKLKLELKMELSLEQQFIGEHILPMHRIRSQNLK